MDDIIFDFISKEIKSNKTVAMALITKASGSIPAKEGSILLVFEDGSISGTVGGGVLENEVIKECKKSLRTHENNLYTYSLAAGEDLGAQCGGKAEIFIKIFRPKEKIIIAGGGHIGLKLYEISKTLGLHTVIIDDREEFVSKDRFPQAQELICGNIYEGLKNYDINQNTYVVIVTRGHEYDEDALRAVIDKNPGYIGMIGSKKKVKYTFDNLRQDGVDEEFIQRVYAPIGLDINGNSPAEIALNIMTQIQLIKKGGTLNHKKDVK
ncbi:XdhC family protein [Tepidibacter sp. Z1-5]|uniref:XdhC family protein n=1 Tax=Tepidibacter sp. Z1-5 TaxID=3134138 RepID=UPI0030C21393